MSEGSSSSVGKWVACGCLVFVVLGVLGFGGIFFFASKILKSNEPYRDSIAAVQSNPDAIAALGEPIKAGFFPSGNISTTNGEGEVDLSIPVSGPLGEGTVKVVGSKAAGGAWLYETWQLSINGNPVPVELGKAPLTPR
jgi:Cytochrome oxidase complex assembly protein 1